MRVADLIEQQDNAASRGCWSAAEHVLEVGLSERFDRQRQPLMDGALRDERCEVVAVENLYRLALAAARRQRPGKQGTSLRLVPC